MAKVSILSKDEVSFWEANVGEHLRIYSSNDTLA